MHRYGLRGVRSPSSNGGALIYAYVTPFAMTELKGSSTLPTSRRLNRSSVRLQVRNNRYRQLRELFPSTRRWRLQAHRLVTSDQSPPQTRKRTPRCLLWHVILRQINPLSKTSTSASLRPRRTQNPVPTFSSKCTLVNLLIFLAPVRFFFFPEALTAVFCAVSRGSTLWPTMDEQETGERGGVRCFMKGVIRTCR